MPCSFGIANATHCPNWLSVLPQIPGIILAAEASRKARAVRKGLGPFESSFIQICIRYLVS